MRTDPTDPISRQAAIVFGLSGILGSLVLFAGDMLFYYNGEGTDFVANMASSSPERIVASGVCALVAAWLYMLGAGQMYYAFQPAKKWLRLTVFLAFAAIMIAYGVVHGAYVAIATCARNGVEVGLSPGALTDLAIAANNALRYVTYLPFAVFTVLFIPAVWTKNTRYPRWMILVSPIIPFLLQGLIVGNLAGKLKVVVAGGYLNLILLVFYSSSTLALWLKRDGE